MSAPVLTPSRPRSERRVEILDGAIAVIGRSGLRGLTHRAVDAHVGSPEGTTSRYFRTRKLLLSATMSQMFERSIEASRVGELQPKTANDVARGLMTIVQRMTAPATRDLMVAHFELGLQAARDDDLRAAFTQFRVAYTEHAVRLVREAGGAAPERSGTALALFVNGLVLERLWRREDVLSVEATIEQIEHIVDADRPAYR